MEIGVGIANMIEVDWNTNRDDNLTPDGKFMYGGATPTIALFGTYGDRIGIHTMSS